MSKQTYLFVGKMRAEQPLTVSLPNIEGLPRLGGKHSERYFPSGSLRGAFRHAAHQRVLNLVKEKTGESHPFSVDDHFLLAQGLLPRDAKGFAPGVVDADKVLREKNPFLSLFGCWGMESKLSVSNAIALSGDSWGEMGQGVRSDIFTRTPSLVDELSHSEKEVLALYKTEQSESSKSIEPIKKEIASLKRAYRSASSSEREEIGAKINESEAQIKEIKEGKAGHKDSILRPLPGYEAFYSGAEFEHKMILRGATEVELGLLLNALAQFAREPILGGHVAQGNGLVSFDWTVKTWEDKKHLAPDAVAQVTLSIEEGLSITGKQAKKFKKYMAQFEDSIESFNFKMVPGE